MDSLFITEHCRRSITHQPLVYLTKIISLEVIQTVNGVEVLLREPVSRLTVSFAFIPFATTQELQPVLVILAAVTSCISATGSGSDIKTISYELMFNGGNISIMEHTIKRMVKLTGIVYRRREIHLLKPSKNFIKTITTDNGTEFASHERISQDLEAPVYFADPYTSWQKGGIENENGLIRQYIPKSTKMLDVSHQDVNRIMHKINRRPRDT